MYPFMLSRCCRWISTSRVCLVRKQENPKYSHEFTKSKWSFSFYEEILISYRGWTGTLSERCLKVNVKNYLYLPHVVTLALVRIERMYATSMTFFRTLQLTEGEKKELKTVDRFSWKISENFTFFCWKLLFAAGHGFLLYDIHTWSNGSIFPPQADPTDHVKFDWMQLHLSVEKNDECLHAAAKLSLNFIFFVQKQNRSTDKREDHAAARETRWEKSEYKVQVEWEGKETSTDHDLLVFLI